VKGKEKGKGKGGEGTGEGEEGEGREGGAPTHATTQTRASAPNLIINSVQ
jgi:hypothetical protein